MIQNILENQIYLALAKSKKDNKILTNKFHESNSNNINVSNEQINPEINSNKMDLEDNDLFEEEDFGFNSDLIENILSERLVINAIPIPGLERWFIERYFKDYNDKSSYEDYLSLSNRKILVYDYDEKNADLKVNDERLTIGLAYFYSDFIILHSWFNINNYLTEYIPKEIVLSNDNLSEIRNEMLLFFNSIFPNEVLSEYLILLMTSQIIKKVGSHLLGKLSLNIQINPKQETTKQNILFYIKEILQNIANCTISLNITTNALNKSTLIPRYNIETEELNKGELQMLKNSLLILDEADLDNGKLDKNGLDNFDALKNLIDTQVLQYEFPYSKIDMPQDCKIISLSKGKSLLKSEFLLEVSFYLYT